MDPIATKQTCEKILQSYKSDPEFGHEYEDKFLQRFLRTLVSEIQKLPNESEQIKEFQKTTQECMSYIDQMLRTERTKWFA